MYFYYLFKKCVRTYEYRCPQRPEVSDHLELELQTIVNHLIEQLELDMGLCRSRGCTVSHELSSQPSRFRSEAGSRCVAQVSLELVALLPLPVCPTVVTFICFKSLHALYFSEVHQLSLPVVIDSRVCL